MNLRDAQATARYYLKRTSRRDIKFYRVGAAWMTTTQTREEVQKLYKRPVSQFVDIEEMLK
jgi:hypothetical protein